MSQSGGRHSINIAHRLLNQQAPPHQAFVAAMSAPPLSPITPRPGYYNLAGSVAEDRFFFANEMLVHANIAAFVNYVANLTLRDMNCGLAGAAVAISRLKRSVVPSNIHPPSLQREPVSIDFPSGLANKIKRKS